MISAVIPSAGTLGPDGRALLEGALDACSVADETIVVVTDGRMTPEGWEAIRGAGAALVEVTGSFNFSRACNMGARAGMSHDILLMNDDIARDHSTSRDWLERLAGKEADIVGVRLLDLMGHVHHAGVEFCAPGGMPSHIGVGASSYALPSDPRVTALVQRDRPVLAVTGACMLVRREAFDALGGFDQEFPLNYNDIDFCLRARAKGYSVLQADTVTLVHRESSTRGDTPPSPSDYERFALCHADFLRSQGIVIDALAAIRHLASL